MTSHPTGRSFSKAEKNAALTWQTDVNRNAQRVSAQSHTEMVARHKKLVGFSNQFCPIFNPTINTSINN